jgi:chromosome segregation ATPase
MEDELKAISAELASSIRREMDLEDLVDRLQDQVNNPQAPGKRTSDYFSDSGYSSAKFSDYDHAKEEISQIQRRAEQEKAQITLELTQKLQDERDRRKKLDQQIMELSHKASQVDLARTNSEDATSRIQELETTCDELRRKLADERQVKNNFEDLLSVLKGELNGATNERDNLRDEVVPQLRARVEGLEAQAAESTKTTYDTTKIQHELQTLKNENSQLKELEWRRNQEVQTLISEASDLRQLGSRRSMEIRTLRDEFADLKHTTVSHGSVGLSRSASVTAGPQKNRPAALSLSRSNTTKQVDSRDAIAERLKDVEAQRDALHSALKSLLERQELQNRENQKRIRALEAERERLLTASPPKSGYEREVSILRDEIKVLRRRAEEAVEQKWQVEKGLSGLKMDLDRAETEIAQLRSLLQENDILIPETYARSSVSSYGSNNSVALLPVTSASLEKAYKDLQAAYADALQRIKSLETSTSSDEKTLLAMQRLEHSLAAAISQRDHAQHEADSYRKRIESLQASEHAQLSAEKDLADQLRESARRVEELAQQVRTQLATNSALRNRLAEAVSRGEAEHRANKDRITSMQARLRTLEEELIAAQTASEERVARHEDDIAALKETQAAQLQRLRDNPAALRSPRPLLAPRTPSTPAFAFAGAGVPKSPRLLSVSRPGTSGSASSPRATTPSRLSLRRNSTAPADTGDAGEVETLRAKVRELEAALAAAEGEMQEVVGRMSAAQIEVMNLQEEREQAVRETRRVQKLLEDERLSVFETRFRSITTEVR